MGGLGPGIGGSEWFIIGLVALLVVGPERLPGLLRQLGKMVGKARGMANEFRSSFDEMARQSELDDLRKEVEALRTGQGPAALGATATQAFKDIKSEMDKPLFTDPVSPAPAEWRDGDPVMMPIAPPPLVDTDPAEPEPVATKPRPAPRKTAKAKSAPTAKTPPAKVATAKVAEKTPKTVAAPTSAKAKSRAPRNSKLDL